MKKRAQSSIEFLAVTGIGLLLIVTVSMVYLSYSKGNEDRNKLEQATSIGQTILQQATTVYSLGKNSWVTVEVSMPNNVQAVYTAENSALVFDVGTQIGVVSEPIFTHIPIQGVNTTGMISYVNNGSVLIHSGKTQFRIMSNGANVTIQAIT